MLQIENLHSYYGTIKAVKGINLTVPDGKIICLIGANGAGKTTTLKSISGMVKHTGSIRFNGIDITKASAKQVCKAGVIHVPEGRLVFPGLTVYENLEVGTIGWHGFLGHASYQDDMEKVFSLFPRLKERSNQQAWSLSGGEQQMLAIGRGLMARPRLLMLDEPSMGLAPLVIEEVFNKIRDINDQGISILLIEQNAKKALENSDYAYVIEQGEIKFEGNAKELVHDSRITKAYLGDFSKDE